MAAFPPIYPVQMACYPIPAGGIPAQVPMMPGIPGLSGMPVVQPTAPAVVTPTAVPPAVVPPAVAPAATSNTNSKNSNSNSNRSPESTLNKAGNTISKASRFVKTYGPAVGTAAKMAGKAVPGLSQAILAAEIAGEYGPKAASFAKSAFSRHKNDNNEDKLKANKLNAEIKQSGGFSRKMVNRRTRRRSTRRGGAITIPASPPPLSKLNTYTSWPGGVDPTAKLYNQSAMLGGYQRGGMSPEFKAYKASLKVLAQMYPEDADVAYGVLYQNLYVHQSKGGPQFNSVNNIPANDRKKLSEGATRSLDYALKLCNQLDMDELMEAGEALTEAFPEQHKKNSGSKGGKKGKKRSTRRR